MAHPGAAPRCRAHEPRGERGTSGAEYPEEEKAGRIAGLAADLEVVVKHPAQFDRIEQREEQRVCTIKTRKGGEIKQIPIPCTN